MTANKQPIPLNQVLKNVLKKQGLSRELEKYELWESWGQIVGLELAKHSHPSQWKGNTLWIAVQHSAWIQEMQFLKAELLKKIKSSNPQLNIEDLRFVLAR